MLQLLKRLRQFQYTTLRTGQEDYMVKKELYLACIGTKQVWKDKEETVNKVAEVEYWLNCSNMGVTYSKKKLETMRDKEKSQLMLYSKTSTLFCIVSCSAWNFCVETAIVQVKQYPHHMWVGWVRTLHHLKIIPATQLMFTQLGLQTLWLAYLQSLELFSITQLYICVYIFFNQPFLPGRVQH